MTVSIGEKMAVQNNLNSIIEGARRLCDHPETSASDVRALLRVLRKTDTEVWVGVRDDSARSNKQRLEL